MTNCLKIASTNVRSLRWREGNHVKGLMSTLDCNVLALQETHLRNDDDNRRIIICNPGIQIFFENGKETQVEPLWPSGKMSLTPLTTYPCPPTWRLRKITSCEVEFAQRKSLYGAPDTILSVSMHQTSPPTAAPSTVISYQPRKICQLAQ